MVGLGVSVVFSLVLLMMGRELPAIYKRATGFLFKWYLVVAAVTTAVLCFLAVSGTTVIGFLAGGLIGALTGWAVGGVLALLVIIWTAIAYVFQIFGAKMLHNALQVKPDGTCAWNTLQLAVGLLLLVLGVIGLPMMS